MFIFCLKQFSGQTSNLKVKVGNTHFTKSILSILYYFIINSKKKIEL